MGGMRVNAMKMASLPEEESTMDWSLGARQRMVEVLSGVKTIGPL